MQVCLQHSSSDEPPLSWYHLPVEVKRLLIAAANTWEDTTLSQSYIRRALAIANQSLDVLVAAYRYFFYKRNDAAALQIANQLIEQIQQLEKLPNDWNLLAPILKQRKEDPNIRLYLNAYAASGLVLARLGVMDEAKTISRRVSDIDDRREFGAATVLQILTHPVEEEEE
jgi:hypothetical protein